MYAHTYVHVELEDNVIDQINLEICIGRRRQRLRQHLKHVLDRQLELRQ